MTKDEDIYFIDGKEYRATKHSLTAAIKICTWDSAERFVFNVDGK